MLAAVLTALNKPLELIDVEPQRLDYGQVLVKMICSGICGAQLQEIRGEKGNAAHLPHLLGHEGCGTVEQVGQGVSRVKPGQKVCLHWRKASGIEANPPAYGSARGRVGSGRLATLARQCVVSENRITPVPDDTPPELAALLGCGLSTALGTVEREANCKMGESVLIVGCGGLGLNLIRACKTVGMTPIACCDVHASKEKVAMQLGATEYIDSKPDELTMADPWVDSWAYHNPKRFDVIIETSGNTRAIEGALRLLGPSGRFIMVGHAPPGYWVHLFDVDHLFGGEGKTIKATQGGGFQPDRDIPRYIAAASAGVLSIADIVTHRLSLEQVNEGIDLVRSGQAGRVMIYTEAE